LFLGSIQLRLNPAVISSDVASLVSALAENDPARAVASYIAPLLGTRLEVLSADATTRGDH
jgi:hypothetical protein